MPKIEIIAKFMLDGEIKSVIESLSVESLEESLYIFKKIEDKIKSGDYDGKLY